jgi:phage major head subunit gpT-like protein
MILGTDLISAANTAFRADYDAGKLEAKPIYQDLSMTIKSSAAEETYAWLGLNSSLREWVGDKHFNSLKVSGFTIKNRDFEHTITVRRNDIEDDKIGIMSGAFKMLGFDAALHPDTLLFELIKNGTSQKGYDGKPFFSPSHPLDPFDPKSGTLSNYFKSDDPAHGDNIKWVLLDTTKAIKPFILQVRKDYNFITQDEDADDHVFRRGEFVYGVEARLNAGYGLWQLAFASNSPIEGDMAGGIMDADAAMMSIKSSTGKPLGISPNILMVAPSQKWNAMKLIKTPDTHFYNAFELIICPWLE